MINVRSALSAGLAGAAVISPVTAPPMPVMISPAVQLSALVASLPRPAAITKPLRQRVAE